MNKRLAAKVILTLGCAVQVALDQLGITGHLPLAVNIALLGFWIWEPW